MQPFDTANTNSTAQIIWDTITDLRDNGQAVSRQRLVELTGLTFSKVDDHVSRWIDDGRLCRVVDGVFEVVEPIPEPRAVSVTDLHNHMVLIEIGDQELRVYTPEARALARQLGGFALQYAQLQTQQDMASVLVEATVRNRALAVRVGDLEREQRKMKQYAFTWTSDRVQLLGTANDRELATMFGIDTAIVAAERRKRGIPRYRPAESAAPVVQGVGEIES